MQILLLLLYSGMNKYQCFKRGKKASSKEKNLYFYCINNDKIKIFLYRLYIYSRVWLEGTADTYGIQFSFIHSFIHSDNLQ